jgi:hypothetical protein
MYTQNKSTSFIVRKEWSWFRKKYIIILRYLGTSEQGGAHYRYVSINSWALGKGKQEEEEIQEH